MKTGTGDRRRPGAAAVALLLTVVAVALSGCGSSSASGAGDGGGGKLIVLGASSLTEAVSEYAASFPGADAKASFAGSDQLAAQIRQGVKADVFASADTEYPAQLYKEGLVEKPRRFAGNELVLAVPEGSDVRKLSDLAKPGVRLVIGDSTVPVGEYTRTVLRRLPAAERAAIIGNVRAEESEVAAIVAKLEEGAADAGFVYITDEKAASGLEAIELPRSLQPEVAYAAAVVKAGGDGPAADRFLAGLIHGKGQRDLRRAGFLPPP